MAPDPKRKWCEKHGTYLLIIDDDDSCPRCTAVAEEKYGIDSGDEE